MTYRRSVAKIFAPTETVKPALPRSEDPPARFCTPLLGDRKRKRTGDEDDDVVLFRRVRVKASVILSSRPPLESLVAIFSADPPAGEAEFVKRSEDHHSEPFLVTCGHTSVI